MKASINIQLDELDEGDLQRIFQALHGGATALTVTGVPEAVAEALGRLEDIKKHLSPEEIAAVKKRIGDLTVAVCIDQGAARAAGGDEAPPPAPEADAPPAGTKAKRGRPAKAKAPETDAPKVEYPRPDSLPVSTFTDNAVKTAIQAAVKARGVDAVRKIVAQFKTTDGQPVAQLSKLQPKDFEAIVAALEAPDGE